MSTLSTSGSRNARAGQQGDEERPRWNPSTQDEAHPFPERAITHSVGHYSGVEVVDTYFPEAVKGTTALRITGDPDKKTKLWERNQTRARESNHHTFQLKAGADDEHGQTRLSYLATVIMEDNKPEKKLLRQGWDGGCALDGRLGNFHMRPAGPFVDYVALNKTKTELMDTVNATYRTPFQRAADSLAATEQERQQTQRGSTMTGCSGEMTLSGSGERPAVFKMSNIDQWWALDPVQVAREQTIAKGTRRTSSRQK